MKNNSIGIFDSGVGGTSIWKEISSLLPHENCVYIADSKNAPYGRRSQKEITDLSIACANKLIELNCKIIVVACNTATTNAISYLRENYSVPIIGIEPAIKPALLKTKTNNIGVLATKGTLTSSLFESTKNNFGEDVNIIEQVGTGLVELIEENKLESIELKQLLQSYLAPMIDAQIDYLVLGCSHYPYLKPLLHNLLPSNVQIIDSGQAVAQQIERVLKESKILNILNQNGSHQFLSTTENFETLKSLTMEGIENKTYSFISL